MIIKRVRLHNIRSYTDQEFIFPEGITLLSGDIGAGKSSILLAVEFALFGFNRKSLTGDILLRFGRQEGYVELEFTINNQNVNNNDNIKQHNVIIKRNLRRANTVKQESGYIVVDNVKTECTPVELKTRILDLLGYPHNVVSKNKDVIFRYTVYTPQEQMKLILTDDKEKRLETLRKVFNIDKYKRIKTNTAMIIRELKNKKAELTGKISDLNEKNKIKTEKEQQINSLNEKKELFSRQLNEIKQNKTIKQKEFDEIENKIKQLNELNNKLNIEKVKLNNNLEQKENNENKINQIKEQIILLRNKLVEFNKIASSFPKDVDEKQLMVDIGLEEKKLFVLREKKIKVTQEIQFINDKIADISSEIQQKKESAKDIPKMKLYISQLTDELLEKEKISAEIKELERKNNELEVQIKEKEIIITNADELKKKIMDMADCPMCLQKINADHKAHICLVEDKKMMNSKELIVDIFEEKKEIGDKLKKLTEKAELFAEKEKKLTELKFKFENLNKINSELTEKQILMEDLVKKRNILNNENIDLDNLNLGLIQRKVSEKKEKLRLLIEYKNKIKEKELLMQNIMEKQKILLELNQDNESIIQLTKGLLSKIKEYESNLFSFDDLNENFNKIKQEREVIVLEERKIELENAKLEKEIQGITLQIAELTKEIDEKLTAKKQIEKTNNMINWLQEMFINLMTVMEKHIMYKLYHEFNEVFVNWFNILMEDENLNVKLDDEFTPVIIQNGYETSIENLSGGEKTAVSLAYRLALNKVINGFMTQINTKDIIILDEPTDGFSHEQLDRIKDVLDEIGVKQIIIVSHEPKIESFAENIIRINKEEHVSAII